MNRFHKMPIELVIPRALSINNPYVQHIMMLIKWSIDWRSFSFATSNSFSFSMHFSSNRIIHVRKQSTEKVKMLSIDCIYWIYKLVFYMLHKWIRKNSSDRKEQMIIKLICLDTVTDTLLHSLDNPVFYIFNDLLWRFLRWTIVASVKKIYMNLYWGKLTQCTNRILRGSQTQLQFAYVKWEIAFFDLPYTERADDDQ